MAKRTVIGKIFKVEVIADDKAYIVMRAKDGDQFIQVAYDIYGYQKRQLIDELKLEVGDKIRFNQVVSSRKYQGRWYTSARMKHVDLIERAPVKSSGSLFPAMRVDEETGEVFED